MAWGPLDRRRRCPGWGFDAAPESAERTASAMARLLDLSPQPGASKANSSHLRWRAKVAKLTWRLRPELE